MSPVELAQRVNKKDWQLDELGPIEITTSLASIISTTTSRSGLRCAGPKRGTYGVLVVSGFFWFLGDVTPGLLGRNATLCKLALSCVWVVVRLSLFLHSL